MKKRDWIVAIVLGILFSVFNFNGDFAVTYQCEWWKHITFNFVHGNIFHLLCNSLCVYSILTKCDISIRKWVTAFVMASLLSFACTLGKPLVGFSGVLFCICGFNYAEVNWDYVPTNRKIYIAVMFIIPFAVGFFFGQGSALLLHILCFGFGYGVELLAEYIKSVAKDERRTR